MENPFIVDGNLEKRLTARDYLMQELLEDISIFSDSAQEAIKKLSRGEDNLNDNEATV